MDGLIITDKPAGWTSHDVVVKLRKILGEKRIGHAGTLDPLATGVLIITVGQATRLFPYLSRADKTYTGQITLGQATDTYDSLGKLVGEKCQQYPDINPVEKALESLTGELDQFPPPFSAKKINGQRAFELARRGQRPELKPVKINVYRFFVLNYQPPEITFQVECSSGTYIRSLAHELGQKLGCGAHLSKLRRIVSGPYSEADARSPKQIEELQRAQLSSQFIIPLDYVLSWQPAIWVEANGQLKFQHGQPLGLQDLIKVDLRRRDQADPAIFRVLTEDNHLLGLARFKPEEKLFQPDVVFQRQRSSSL
ncbi:MAG TPA: tRNA pseudouridine(55) synthase TruB [Candidatus Saccharicenans sp.]|jgi:tRNA pseudouridine55 synthase|nr:tRNA pseudouridine(55) synthase TruB [Candidatus Saccharicenans sp.]HRD02402.1 tRNA pseudouridine(55) synthase TruB [Candidatus Saccharicenans sp.]